MRRGLNRGDVHLFAFPFLDKTRPVVILTRDSLGPYLTKVTVAPVTSNIRGMPSVFLLDESDGMKTLCAVNLHGVMTVPKEKLGKWITTLEARHMESICRALRFALECDCPS